MTDSITVSVEAGADTDEIELPTALVDLFRENDGETDAQIAADMLVMAFSERAHALAHHGESDNQEAIQEMESEMMELFEDRFGLTYAELTGHSH